MHNVMSMFGNWTRRYRLPGRYNLILISFFRQGARGFSNDIIVIDEFLFVKDEIVYKLALPQISVDLRAMFILCSPLEAECPRMKMLQRRSSITNLPYFSILELGTVCAPCSLAKEPVCPHLYDNRPAWKSTKTEQMLRDLMSDRTFRTEVNFFFIWSCIWKV